MTKLREVIGKLWRKSPEYPKHMTVYGYETLTKFVCVVCKEEGYLAEAYMKSVRDKNCIFQPKYHHNLLGIVPLWLP